MTDRTDNQDFPANVIQAAREILSQGICLLESIDNQVYTIVVPEAFDSTIGAHYRHCLDHFSCFLAGISGSGINYDHRQRDTVQENDRFAALNRSREIMEEITQLASDNPHDQPVQVTSKISYTDASSQKAGSTLSRELMYVVSHAMHHFALIRIMSRLLDVSLPAQFGVAPSTLQHQHTAARFKDVEALSE